MMGGDLPAGQAGSPLSKGEKYSILHFMFELIIFAAAALFGSGVLFAHTRILTYIALAGALFQAQIMAASFIARAYLPTQDRDSVFLVAGIIFLTIWASLYKQWTSPYKTPGSGMRDAFVGIVLLLVLAGAYPIVKSNGFIGEEFVLHGFYNGDVVTFASLIQKSFDTTGLVTQNPFSGNGSLEYPTVLHGTFADFFTLLGIGKDWLYYLGIMTYAGIFFTIPLFFLLWDTIWPQPANPAERWFGVPSRVYIYALQALLTLFAIGISFDSFTYPQSHFFLMGLELAAIALFARSAVAIGTTQILSITTAGILAAILLLSNSVTGTVAAALAGILCFIRVFDKKRSVRERAIFLALGFCVLIAIKAAAVGRTELNNPHFSVSSAGEMIRAGLPVFAVLLASIFSLSRKQYIAIASLLVGVLGFVTFALSSRAIVTENASRFLYHSFLIGLPLLLPFIIQAIYSIRRELMLTLRPLSEVIAGWIGVVCILGILVLPVGISVGSTYLSLVKSEPYRINLATRTALWWLGDHATPQDVIITSPEAPYIVPLFTGVSVLRLHDYWLSAQDETMNDTVTAFSGDKDAQERVMQQGKYLVLNAANKDSWDTSKLKKVFEAPDAIVYNTQ